MFRPMLTTIVVTLPLLSPFAFAGEPDHSGKLGIAANYPGDVGIEADEAVIFAEDFEIGSLADVGKNRSTAAKHEVVALESPAYQPNEMFLMQEDLRSPRFKDLRSRYGLDEVVKGGNDEFERILLLRNWIRRRIVTDQSKPAVDNDDALQILDCPPVCRRVSRGRGKP